MYNCMKILWDLVPGTAFRDGYFDIDGLYFVARSCFRSFSLPCFDQFLITKSKVMCTVLRSHTNNHIHNKR